MYKKIISLAAAALLTASCLASPISAESFYNSTPAVMSGNSWIAPCYDNVATVTAGISISSSNKANCSGSYDMYSGKKSVITISLMKSTNGSTNWSEVESWSTTYRTAGSLSLSQTSSSALSSSYYYCTYVQVQIYNSRNELIETVTSLSPVTHL